MWIGYHTYVTYTLLPTSLRDFNGKFVHLTFKVPEQISTYILYL